jgi:hypothetical protein
MAQAVGCNTISARYGQSAVTTSGDLVLSDLGSRSFQFSDLGSHSVQFSDLGSHSVSFQLSDPIQFVVAGFYPVRFSTGYTARISGYFQNAHSAYESITTPPLKIAHCTPTKRDIDPAMNDPIGVNPT